MARHEGRFEADGKGPLDLDQLLQLLTPEGSSQTSARERARVCYLSSSDGWREAVKELGGAFARVPAADGTQEK